MSPMSQIFHRVTWPKLTDLKMAVCGISEAFLGFIHRHSSILRTFKIGHIELKDKSKTWRDAFEKVPPAMSLTDVLIKGLQDVKFKANARSNDEVSVRRTRKIHENYLAGVSRYLKLGGDAQYPTYYLISGAESSRQCPWESTYNDSTLHATSGRGRFTLVKNFVSTASS